MLNDTVSDDCGAAAGEGSAAPAKITMREIPAHERPQERLVKLGPRALTDAELIAMILRTGTAGENVAEVANGLINTAGSLKNLVEWTGEDFAHRKGIGTVKALQLVTVMEIARRIREQDRAKPVPLNSPTLIAEFFAPIVQGVTVEKCWVVCMNIRHCLLRYAEISSGTVQGTVMHPREVFQTALRLGAVAVAVVHNHPSGDPEPSRADCVATRRLAETAKVIDIDFLDHVIIGDKAADKAGLGWFSFKQAGLL